MAESERYVHIQTFGCQMNIYDTERMLQVLGEDGYASTEDPARADLILLNTCSVREKAEHKAATGASAAADDASDSD